MMRKLISILLLFQHFSSASFSQSKDDLLKLQDSLKVLGNQMPTLKPEFARYECNEKFNKMLGGLLESQGSFELSWDSVRYMSVITPADESFRLYTWAVRKDNGNYEYFGYLQLNPKADEGEKLYELNDKSDYISSPELKLLAPDNWLGAVYYKVIQTKYKGRKSYTLLGWKGNSSLTTKKVIEVISFKSSGSPVFGAALFRKYKEKEKPVRVVFEYSAKASMSLKYEKQFMHVFKKKKNKKKKDVLKRENMIVFDRLGPLDTRVSEYSTDLEGQYQFYVPETNIIDAFVFRNGRWVYVKDIDARNPPPPRKKKALPSPKL
jgi:hypothetical protein